MALKRGSNPYVVPANRIHSFAAMLKEMTPKLDPIDLTIGQPNENPPMSVIMGLKNPTYMAPCRYSPAEGLPQLREAVANMLRTEGGVKVAADDVLITQGTRPLIYHLIQGLCGKDAKTLLLEPAWSGYTEELAGLETPYEIAPCDQSCKSDISAVIEKMDQHTKCVIVNWPNNPSGECIKFLDLEAITEKAERIGAGVILDLAYYRYTCDHLRDQMMTYLRMHLNENVIPLFTMSKSLSLCGMRVGSGIIKDRALYSDVRGLNANISTSANICGQIAALHGLKEIKSFGEEQARRYSMKRYSLNSTLRNCASYKLMPCEGGMFQYIGIDRMGIDSETFAVELYRKFGVGVIPGKIFGRDTPCGNTQDSYIRVSLVATEKEIKEAAHRMIAFASEIEDGKKAK